MASPDHDFGPARHFSKLSRSTKFSMRVLDAMDIWNLGQKLHCAPCCRLCHDKFKPGDIVLSHAGRIYHKDCFLKVARSYSGLNEAYQRKLGVTA